MAKFTQDQIEQALTAKSERLTPNDVRRIAESREVVMKMVEEFPSEWSQAKLQARLLLDIIEASSKGRVDIALDELRVAAGALIYLADALDIIPDDEEDGFADDAAIVALATQKSEKQVRLYCELESLDPAHYLD